MHISCEEGQQLFTCPPLVWWPAVLWGQSVWAWLWRWGFCQNLGDRLLPGGLGQSCRVGVFLPDRAVKLCWLAGPWVAAAAAVVVPRKTYEWTGAPPPAALPTERWNKNWSQHAVRWNIAWWRALWNRCAQTAFKEWNQTFRSCSAFSAACVPLGPRDGPGGPRGGWLCCGCWGRGWGMRPPPTLGDIGGPMGERWTPPVNELAWGGRTRGETMLGWDKIWNKQVRLVFPESNQCVQQILSNAQCVSVNLPVGWTGQGSAVSSSCQQSWAGTASGTAYCSSYWTGC